VDSRRSALARTRDVQDIDSILLDPGAHRRGRRAGIEIAT
jgi:hypothetical protein